MCLKCCFQYSKRFIQQIIGATDRDMELLYRFLQAAFLMQEPKAAMMLIQNGLLRVQHQTVNRCHWCTPCQNI